MGASILYVFAQNQIITKDGQISGLQTQVSDLQNRVGTLESYISANGQKPVGIAGATPAAAPKAAVQNVSVIQGGLLVMTKAVSGQDVTISAAWVNNATGIIVTMNTQLYRTVLPMNGTLTSITLQMPDGIMSSGNIYYVPLVSAKGEPFVSATFIMP